MTGIKDPKFIFKTALTSYRKGLPKFQMQYTKAKINQVNIYFLTY